MNTTSVFRDISEVMQMKSKSSASNKTLNRRTKAGSRLPAGSSSLASSPFASGSRDPKKLCRLPYAGGAGSNLIQVKASATTMLGKERAAESRRRMNAQLVI